MNPLHWIVDAYRAWVERRAAKRLKIRVHSAPIDGAADRTIALHRQIQNHKKGVERE
jgi:uncharacterized protein YggU (UPF0235/DUF167 family)